MAEQLSQVAMILTGQTPEPDAGAPDEDSQETGAQESTPALLDQVDPPAIETPTGDTDSTADDAPLKVKDLAIKAGLTPAALYKALRIDVGDGATLSLGEIKDRAKDLVKADKILADSEAKRLQSDNDIMKGRRELNHAMQRLSRPLSPAEKADADREHQAYVQRENEQALVMIPEWRDPLVQRRELEMAAAQMKLMGFKPAEIGNTTDHRFLMTFRRLALLEERIVNAGKSEVKPTANLKGRGQSKSAPKQTSAGELFKAGKLSRNQAILRAIADGAKK